METPKEVTSLSLVATCITVNIQEWKEFMKGRTRANKRRIDALIKKHLPDLYESVALAYYNPYVYYKTKTHLIMVHSGIEYFLEYTI